MFSNPKGATIDSWRDCVPRIRSRSSDFAFCTSGRTLRGAAEGAGVVTGFELSPPPKLILVSQRNSYAEHNFMVFLGSFVFPVPVLILYEEDVIIDKAYYRGYLLVVVI